MAMSGRSQHHNYYEAEKAKPLDINIKPNNVINSNDIQCKCLDQTHQYYYSIINNIYRPIINNIYYLIINNIYYPIINNI